MEPFFVCILGQRYGWVPEPSLLKSKRDRQRQQNENLSITDMEVRHAVLNSNLKRRSYFYLRADEAPSIASEYVDPSPLLEKLEQLKHHVRTCGRPVREYMCDWTGDGFAGMEEFGRHVLDDLWSGLLRDERYVSKEAWRQVLDADPDFDTLYTDESKPVPPDLAEELVMLAKPVPPSPLDAEKQQMEAFGQKRLSWFRGRTKELKQLTNFINSSDDRSPRLAAVVAAPGQGKSALLAKLWHKLDSSEGRAARSPESQMGVGCGEILSSIPSTFLITHFVGATDRSGSAYAMVERLLDELDRSGIKWPAGEKREGPVPERDFNSMRIRLAQRLGDYSGERRIVILIDGLNQLSDGHDLVWLPDLLGPSVRVIVSCVDVAVIPKPSFIGRKKAADRPDEDSTFAERVLSALESRRPSVLFVSLRDLTKTDVRRIVVAYLKEYCHELERENLDTLCAIAQTRNPLYLLVMLNELRTLGGNDLNRIVPARIASMSQDHPDAVSLFRWALQRLEVFGPDTVRCWCLYLAHGRAGMASHELADLLARKLGRDAARMALRIERGLRRYLQRRGSQLDFSHDQLRQAVFEQYSNHLPLTEVHGDIAGYFDEQDNYLKSAEEQRSRTHLVSPRDHQVNIRKVEELPWQRLHSEQWDELGCLLTDLWFLDAKAAAGLVFDLSRDFEMTLTAFPSEHMQQLNLKLIAEALRRDVNFIVRHPATLFQCLWNSCWWYDAPEATVHYKDTFGDQSSDDAFSGQLAQLMTSWKAQMQLKTRRPWLRYVVPPVVRLGGSQFRVLRGQQYVHAIAISRDGQIVASAGKGVWLWNPTTGIRLAQLYTDLEVWEVAFSPAENRLAVGLNSGDIAIWDVATRTEKYRLRGHEKHIRHLAYSGDGKRMVSCSADGTLRVWDMQKRGEIAQWTEHEDEYSDLYFRGAGFLRSEGEVVYADVRGLVYRCNYTTGEKKTLVKTAIDHAADMAVSPTGRQFAVVGNSVPDPDIPPFSLQVFNTEPRMIFPLQGHRDDLESVAYSNHGSRIVSGSNDGTARLWEAPASPTEIWDGSLIIGQPKLTPLRTFYGHEGKVSSVAIAPNGDWCASSGLDATVRLWDCGQPDGALERRGGHLVRGISSIAFSSDGELFATTGSLREQYVCIWSSATGRCIRNIATKILATSPEFHPVSAKLAYCDSRKGLVTYDLEGRKEQTIVPVSTELMPVQATYFSDGSKMALLTISKSSIRELGSNQFVPSIIESSSGCEICRFEAHGCSIAVSPDGRLLALGDQEGVVRILDVSSREERGRYIGKGSIVDVAFSPDGKNIVSREVLPFRLRVWNLATNTCVEEIIGRGDVRALAAALVDRKSLAFVQDGEVRVYDANRHRVLARMPGAWSELRQHPHRNLWAAGGAHVPQLFELASD